MKFGLFYEHQLPRPWDEAAEARVYRDALEQIELADRLGYHYVWEVEHHFLEEYSHSSAPEVFLAACSQRTRQIRLGHGIMLMPPAYNHPARAAERIATLDLVSGGRVEWGTGSSATAIETGGFGLDPEVKDDAWREAAEQAANMLTMSPYPGFQGRYFEMPCRNVVPKSIQKPHPPMWLACSRRETIHTAARNGLGALAFAFVEPEQAQQWVEDYYSIIKSDECVPLGHTVNPNLAFVLGFSVHEDEQEAIRRGLDGFRFFGYSLAYYAGFGVHQPGVSDVYSRFESVKDTLPQHAGQGGIGTPEQVREHLKRYEDVGVDQIIFVQESGRNEHRHVCDSLELFATDLLPEFQARDRVREEAKRQELAPYVEAALARKPRLEPMEPSAVPAVEALGLQRAARGEPERAFYNDRGGAIPIPRENPHKERTGADGG